MVLRMARPWKSKSGIYYVRERIPSDVISQARGMKIALPAAAGGGRITIGARTTHAKASLKTREPSVAKERQAHALAWLSRTWEAVRKGPRPLTRKQIVALAGEVYRPFASVLEDDPGPPSAWKRILRMNVDAAQGRYGLASLVIHDTEAQARRASMEERFGAWADGLLRSKAIITDPASREALINEVGRALTEVAEKLQRNAEGDYRADTNADRFPAWEDKRETGSESPITIASLFEGWEREARAANKADKTISEYRRVIRRFSDFLGRDDAAKVTPQDVIRWKDARLSEGRALKTVKDVDLSALKSVFGWAERNHRIAANPARRVTLPLPKQVKERSKGFTDDEALLILRAALSYTADPEENAKTAAAKRWLPWLCALTGARVGEMAQLRRQDVRCAGDHWVVIITPEAGPVKSKERREVPLHPQLVHLGFPAFVEASAPGYLFITATDRASARGGLGGVKNRVAEFVRTIVPDRRVAPNHGWRHRFVTLSRRYGISQELRRMITGHAGKGIDEEVYGDPEGLYAEIKKLPWYSITNLKNTGGEARG